MQSAPALELKLEPSAWQRRILAGGYALAALGWLGAGLHWAPTLAGLLLLAAALRRDRRAPWPCALSFRPGRGWRIAGSQGGVLAAPAVLRARTGRGVTSVTLGAGPGRSLALFDDAFRDAGHKRLRSLLRHCDTGASC